MSTLPAGTPSSSSRRAAPSAAHSPANPEPMTMTAVKCSAPHQSGPAGGVCASWDRSRSSASVDRLTDEGERIGLTGVVPMAVIYLCAHRHRVLVRAALADAGSGAVRHPVLLAAVDSRVDGRP